MKNQFRAGVAFAALLAPALAFAQSTGTIDAEEGEEIVVTGARERPPLQGIGVPDSPKARTVLNNEFLLTQSPGNSILNAINVVPSVNFTNNDPFGSSGGNVRIRGFDGNRISFTWDGLPLNDTGNYAIFSNQAGDPEIVDSVNVNQGTTDVDSPTAASSGGTINYRTITPSEEAGAILVGAVGQTYANRNYYRTFGMLNTGDLFGSGIRAFVSAAGARNEKFRGPGGIDKQQYNIKLFKELDSGNGDFIAIAGHYNQNRNNFYRNLSLAQARLDFRDNGRFDLDNNPLCGRPTPGPGAQNENAFAQTSTTIPANQFTTYNPPAPSGLDTSCTNFYGARINPSNTGNVRFNSKATLSDTLTLSLDLGYQYVLANGGGFTVVSETDARLRGAAGPTGPGRDLNGDSDTLDSIALYTPNTTNTNRYTVLSSLRWDFADDHYARVAYAFDYGRHRQTGEFTFFDAAGFPLGVFGGRGGVPQVTTADGSFLRGRDRFSIAQLSQVSGEYRGNFFDRALEVQIGVRAPFFYRELNQYCYTQASGIQGAGGPGAGNPLCTTQPVNTLRIIGARDAVPTTGAQAYYAPFRAEYKYDKLLPNLGVTVRPVENVQVYAAYAKGFSSPRTDNLYRQPFVGVQPETSDNFDVGIRYNSREVQATFGGFYNRFQNRIVTSFDAVQGLSVDRNVGKVEIKGLEASLNVRPFPWLSFRAWGSYIDAKLKDNIQLGTTTAAVGSIPAGTPIVALTAGKFLVETPEWQYGYTARATLGPVSLGGTFKQVTERAATDVNDVILPGYSTFDLDARFNLRDFGLERTFLQVNVTNLFNTQYLGSINSQIVTATNISGQVSGLALNATVPGGATPTFAPGSPRALIVSLQVGF